ncbi:MAG: MBG domain-containing protein, partial [Verrucomicrobiota bacterium]
MQNRILRHTLFALVAALTVFGSNPNACGQTPITNLVDAADGLLEYWGLALNASHTNDGDWNKRIGEWYGGVAGYDMPWQLPSLGSRNHPFTTAHFRSQLNSKDGSPTSGAHLYALNAPRSAPNIQATDSSDCVSNALGTVIKANYLNPSSTVRAGSSGPDIELDAAGDAALTAYLNTAYAGGANAGKYVFLTILWDPTAPKPGSGQGYTVINRESGNPLEAASIAYTSPQATTTTAGTATATAAGQTSITVAAPYADDSNENNTYTVDYKFHSASTWVTWAANAANAASPYTTTITGLTPGASYDVRVTYNDPDGVTGTSQQTISSVATTSAAIAQLQAWTNLYHGTVQTAVATNLVIPAGSSRVLLVAIAASESAASAASVTLTYGGQTLTAVNGDVATSSIRQHTALYYLNNAGLVTAAASDNQTLYATVSGGTARITDVFAAVYDGVNQTTPVADSKTWNNGTTAGSTFALSTGLAVNAGNQAVEMISSLRSGSTTLRTISTIPTSWSLAAGQSWNTTDGVTNFVAKRAIPSSNVSADTTSWTMSGTSLGSMTALSLGWAGKATPALIVDNPSVPYDGSAHSATVLCAVAGTVSNVKYNGSTTVPSAAGTYAITADFAPTDTSNYNSLTGASAGNFVILAAKVTPTLSVGNSPVTYNGSARTATVNGSVAGTVSNVKYNGSSTVPTNANTYAVTANFVPNDTTTYNSLTNASAGNFVIQQATPTLSVTNSPVAYNGSAQAAAVSGSTAGTVSNVKYNGSGTSPTSVGSYAITADFAPTDTGNYNSLTSASAGNFVIQKATPTVTWPGATITYGQSLTNTALTGGSSPVAGAFAYTMPPTTPGAGTYSVAVTFNPTDTNNYNTASTRVNVIVNTAGTSVAVTSSSNPALPGSNVTFTATVSTVNAGIPNGTVQFQSDGSNLGSPVAVDVNGNAVISVAGSALGNGSHIITAVYSCTSASLVNGDFNAGSSGWSTLATNGWVNFEIPDKLNPSKGNYTPALVGVYDGTLELTIGGYSGAYDSAYQIVPATAGVTYRLRVQSGCENWWWPSGEIRMIWLDAATNEISRNVVTNTTAIVANDVGLPYADWINTATAPVGTASLMVELVDPVGTGSVYFDNAKLGVDYNGSTNTLSPNQVIGTPPTVSVNSATICAGNSATLTATNNASSPTYFWSPGGGTTQSITVSPASTTTYTVTVTDGTTGMTNSGSGTVTVNPLPVASINYGGSPYCASGTANVTRTGQSGGTYSSTAGLSINASSGQINLGASTPGTYTVTYSFSNGTCTSSTTASVTINALPVASISYGGSPYCATGTASVTRTGQSGGVYSSTAGLSINAVSGAVNLGASTPGTYTVTYSFSN